MRGIFGIRPVWHATLKKGALTSAALTLTLATSGYSQQITAKGETVLNRVTIVNTHDGTLSPEMAIVIDDGKIVKIVRAKTVKVSGSAKVISLPGKFVVPGYMDMHVHVLDSSSRADDLALMLANGITGIRQMSGSAALLKERKEGSLVLAKESPELLAMPGEILSRANASSPEAAIAEVQKQKTEGADFIKTVDVSPSVFFVALEEAKRQNLPYLGHVSTGVDAAEASRQGMRSIEHLGPIEALAVSCSTAESMIRQAMAKAVPPPLPNSPPEAMAKMMKAMLASPVLGRFISDPTSLQRTQRLIDTYSAEKCEALGKLFVANQTWQVPTLIRLKTAEFADESIYKNDPNLRYVPEATRRFWDGIGQSFTGKMTPESRETLKQMLTLQMKVTKLFDQVGVKMLTGTDFSGIWIVPGFSLHQEFDLLAQCGLAPLKVLQMTTANGAEFLGREANLGSVEAGKDANLVILEGDPTASVENLHKIAAVVRGGTYYPKDALEAIKGRVAAHVAMEGSAGLKTPTP